MHLYFPHFVKKRKWAKESVRWKENHHLLLSYNGLGIVLNILIILFNPQNYSVKDIIIILILHNQKLREAK